MADALPGAVGTAPEIRYESHVVRRLALLTTFFVALNGTALAELSFIEGPYVDRVADGTATVHVRTDADVAVRATFEGGGHTETRSSQPGRIHTVPVSGLPADTEIHVRVEADGHRVGHARFRTPPRETTGTTSFLVVGDCRDGEADHARVIRTMRGDHAFLLHLGDMVPTGGELGQWTQFFRIASPVLSRMPIVPVLGNHEIIAPVGPELYRQHFALPDGGSVAYYVRDHGGIRILVLDSNAPLAPGSPQYEFASRELERAAASPPAQALFVAIHHGPFSSGRHGELEALHTSGLVDAMRRARVDLIFSGHDHMYERGDAGGLKYIVSGGCGSPLYPSNARMPYQLAFVPAFHHTRVQVGSRGIDIDVVDSDGRRIEQCSFARGQPFHCGSRTSHGPRAGIAPTEDRALRYGPALSGGVVLLILGYAALRRMRGPARSTRRS